MYLNFAIGGTNEVKAITKWPRPLNFTDVHSFLDACQYLPKFISHLTRKNKIKKIELAQKHKDTFQLQRKKNLQSTSMGPSESPRVI